MQDNKKTINIPENFKKPDEQAKDILKDIEKSIDNLRKDIVTKPVDLNRYLK